MKTLLTIIFISFSTIILAQTAPPMPIEERHDISRWWWIIGVVLAIGAGIGLYMLIKKDPKKDAVR
jgi:phosphotransferase system  glucose/maltose/N-acetylglucosamine-specific IIC component